MVSGPAAPQKMQRRPPSPGSVSCSSVTCRRYRSRAGTRPRFRARSLSRMASPTTEPQLRNGAHSVSYRAEQLAGVTLVLQRGLAVKPADAATRRTVQNAMIESALTNARALARFFQLSEDVNHEMYLTDWQNPAASLAPVVWSSISQHASHTVKGSREGEQHPGAWPIPELAVALVGALSSFVVALRATGAESAAWFAPDPTSVYDELLAARPDVPATEVSKNPTVGRLTKSLQSYLAVD